MIFRKITERLEQFCRDDDSMSVSGKIFYAPVYMMMFLVKDALPAKMIYEIGEPWSMQAETSGFD